MFFANLDPAQSAAAFSEGPATLVLAGPGSGKTTMLSARASWLLGSGVPASRILALTFSRRAALSMGERICGATPEGAGVVVATFHSFCLMLIRERPDLFGRMEAGVIGDAGRTTALEAIVGPELASAHDLAQVDIARERGAADGLAAEFDAALRATGGVDFAAMTPRVLEACERSPEFRAALQARFDEVLVDEYQDVSPVQERLVRLLFEGGARVWAVGDDDQSLYEFRAADVRRILDFGRSFAGARVLSASSNYRCGAAIVDASRSLIGRNRERAPKVIVARAETSGRVAIRGYETAQAECAAVATAVGRLMAAGVEPSQVAVLGRTRAVVDAVKAWILDPAVAVMTVHAAKGLEWDHVFCCGMEDGVCPSSGAPPEEERRVFYVALTRAKTLFAATYAARRGGAPAFRSPFLDELGCGELAVGDESAWLPSEGALAAPARRPAPWLRTDSGPPGDAAVVAENRRRGRPERSGAAWSASEDAALRNMVDQRFAPAAMADRLKRTQGEIYTRVRRCGLASGPDVARVLVERSRARAVI